jgi:hypothetical protein
MNKVKLISKGLSLSQLTGLGSGELARTPKVRLG